MSIHLNAFDAAETLNGVLFSADVNGKRLQCRVTADVLKMLSDDQSTLLWAFEQS